VSPRERLRQLGFFVRGRINRRLARALNVRRGAMERRPVALADVLRGEDTPLALVRLLEARSDDERQAAVAAWLQARSVPFTRHRFATFEGRGENFAVELGHGDRVLALIAHHDAVPGSPGANDNAAAVGILLSLVDRLARGGVPAGLRVRLLFTAAEEIGYLGARAYVRDVALAGIAGVLSLELCGIGDSLAVWDAGEATPFLSRVTGGLETLGLRADEGYHVVGRIPVFGSDHRAFAAAGIPAYGLSIVPLAQADALRRFVLSPGRSALMHLVRRPVPFDTYHTAGDALPTLQPRALDRVARALEAIVAAA
jgi:hypothetical protein